MKAQNRAGHLARDLDRHHGIDRPYRGHRRDHRAALDASGLVADVGLLLTVEKHVTADGQAHPEQRHDPDRPTHSASPPRHASHSACPWHEWDCCSYIV